MHVMMLSNLFNTLIGKLANTVFEVFLECMKYILSTKTLANMNLIRASQKDPFISNDVHVRIICANGKASYVLLYLLRTEAFSPQSTHLRLIQN